MSIFAYRVGFLLGKVVRRAIDLVKNIWHCWCSPTSYANSLEMEVLFR